MSTNKGLFALAKILLFVCLTVGSAVAFTQTAHAQQQLDVSFNTNGQFTWSGEPVGNNGSGNIDFCFSNALYEDSYPATSTLVQTFGLDCSKYGDSWEDIINAFGLNHAQNATSSGNYWYAIATGSQPTLVYYIPFSVSNGVYSYGQGSSVDIDFSFSSGFNSVTNTRFLDLSFAGSVPTVTYFLDESEINTSIPERNPTQIKYSWAKRPDTDFSSLGYTIDNTVFGTSTNSDGDLSQLTNGTYDLLVQFSNLGVPFGGAVPFPESYIYATIDVQGSNITLVGDLEVYDGQTPIAEDELQECGLTNIAGCIINSFRYLFVPSTASLDNFSEINDSLENKFPFAYAYDFNDAIQTLYSTGQVASAEVTVPFGTFGDITLLSAGLIQSVPLSSLIRTLLGYLIWIMFAVQMYRRTLTVFNSNPT